MHRMHEAHRQQHEFRLEHEFGAGNRLELVVDLTQCSFATLPSAPENFCVSTANSRLAPSAWLDEVRIFSGQFGQVSALVLMLRRRRHDFQLRHRLRALPERGADAVRAGVAAADHHHMLAGGEDLLAPPSGSRRRGGFAAAGNPSRSECRRVRGRGSAGRARLRRRRSRPPRHIAGAARADRSRSAALPPTWTP